MFFFIIHAYNLERLSHCYKSIEIMIYFLSNSHFPTETSQDYCFSVTTLMANIQTISIL